MSENKCFKLTRNYKSTGYLMTKHLFLQQTQNYIRLNTKYYVSAS
jgi:hypothetical protein